MSEKALDQQNTLLLVKKFLQVSKEFESISYAEWWRKPHWWALKRLSRLDFIRLNKLRALSECRDNLVGELSVRYDGIMHELFTCARVGASFEAHFRRVWIELQGRAVTTRQPGLFSRCLWEIQRRCGVAVNELKPKFMLRQFVDDMPAGEPRAALRQFAYSYQVEWPKVRPEAARRMKEGYELLHERVCAQRESLEHLTDGVLNAEMVEGIGSYEYHTWLFYKCRASGS